MPRLVDGIRPEKTPTAPVKTPPISPMQTRRRWHWRTPRWVAKVLYVAGCLALLALALYIYNYRAVTGALSSAQNGLLSLQGGVQHLLTQPKAAQRDFGRAEKFFADSTADLKTLDLLSKSLLALPAARKQLGLLKLGHTAANSGEIIARLLEDPPPPAQGDFAQTMGATTAWLTSWQAKNQDNLSQLLLNLKQMEGISRQTGQMQDTLPKLTRNGQSLLEILRQSPDLFGGRGDRRYMIIFQNNTELRPTGGFIGSYATLLFRADGTAAFNFGPNIYHAITNQQTWQKLPVPYPILDDAQYGLRVYEANWNPDFPTSAALLLKFYESIHSAPAQGVIAVDTSLITDLLAITGPLDFPQYKTTLTADNFLPTIQYKVEKEYFTDASNVQENDPKKILSDLIPVLFKRINSLDMPHKQQIFTLISQAAERRTVQIYSQNKSVEQALTSLGVAGEIKQTTGDYLHINNANVGGFKSSLNITQEVGLQQKVVGQRIQNTLTITRTHTGNGQWPDADNRNYMRLYLPKGSQVVSVKGALEESKVTEENGYTCLSGWFTTPVADKRKADIIYLLPESITPRAYTLTLQRQAGDNASKYTVNSPLLGDRQFELQTDQVLR